jgi:hypothetical protein
MNFLHQVRAFDEKFCNKIQLYEAVLQFECIYKAVHELTFPYLTFHIGLYFFILF